MKKKLTAALLSIALVLGLVGALAACGGGSKDVYRKLTFANSNQLPDHILTVDISSEKSDENKVNYYRVSSEKNQQFVTFSFTCDLGYEPHFTVKTNNTILTPTRVSSETVYYTSSAYDSHLEQYGKVVYTIDAALLSGNDETLSLNFIDDGVQTAQYGLYFEVYAGFTSALDDYEGFTMCITQGIQSYAPTYTYQELVQAQQNSQRVMITYGELFFIQCRMEGVTQPENYDGSSIVWLTAAVTQIENVPMWELEDGTGINYHVEVTDDAVTVTYAFKIYGDGGIVLNVDGLNFYYTA